MNYTPNDLQNITFKKGFMGLNEEMVNDLIDKVIEDYAVYIRENVELKDRLSIMQENIQHYKKIEDSLQNTLLVAQQTSEDIKKNAYDKAENILKEAELRAQRLLSDANNEVVKIKYEHEDLKKRLHIFKSKAETLLISQLEVLKQMFDNDD
jgi:cell division initiation protein